MVILHGGFMVIIHGGFMVIIHVLAFLQTECHKKKTIEVHRQGIEHKIKQRNMLIPIGLLGS